MSLVLVSTSGTFTTDIVEGDKAETIAPIVSGIAVTASGTSVTFTGIPSWAKKIRIMLSGVSSNGTAAYQVQVGTTVFVTTGYLGTSTIFDPSSTSSQTVTTGFRVFALAATAVVHGVMELVRINGDVWVATGIFGQSDTARSNFTGGSISLAAPLTQVRLTTVNGTDVFDAGTVNIMWE